MFAQPTLQVARDRYGNPLIVPEAGGEPVAYRRISGVADTVASREGLADWKLRQVALGMGRRPDLVQLAATVATNSDDADKKKLRGIFKDAMDAASSDAAANVGTSLHTWTERADTGGDLSGMKDPTAIAGVAAYREALEARGLRPLAAEVFVVVDELQVAGTLDRLYAMFPPDGPPLVVVGDTKSGQNSPEYASSTEIQVACYAHGALYDPATGQRTPLSSVGVSQALGLLVHLPAGGGTCTIHSLDLERGWTMAHVAVAVRAWRGTPEAPQWWPAHLAHLGMSADPKPREIRAWAASRGIYCPDRGRVPGAVRAAYEQARLAGAS